MPEDTHNVPEKPITAPLSPTTAPTEKKKQKRFAHLSKPERRAVFAWRGFVVAMAFVVAFSGGWLGAHAYKNHYPSADGNVETQRVIMNEQGDLISSIADTVGKSVVSINVTSTSQRGLFGYSDGQESAGTGVIVSDDGLVLTNRHVVPEGTSSVSVVLSDGTELDDVKVVDRTSDDDSLDVAFLQIGDTKGKKLQAAKIGDSSKMRVGDSVVAIGNALGYFQNTVTTGIVSGYGRSIQASGSSMGETESLEDLFQTDAAINQGNSGGPLVNIGGEVIGINTAVASGEAQNIGFAIPINNIEGLIDSVKSTGEIQRPYLGVVYISVTADVRDKYELKVSEGAYVPKASDHGQATVLENGPAGKAGIREGDVITKIDGKPLDSSSSLSARLAKYSVGDTVRLTIDRNGATEEISVTLGARP